MTERRKILLVNVVQQRRLIMGGLLTGILLLNSLAILSVVMNPTLLELIEPRHTLVLAGIEMVVVAAIAYLSLLVSHKIVGPAYALARDLNRLSSGDLTVRTRLRKGDFHGEVADAFNLAGETLCGRIKTLRATLTILQQQRETPESVRQALKGVLNELDYFNTEPAPPREAAAEDMAHPAMPGMDKPPVIR